MSSGNRAIHGQIECQFSFFRHSSLPILPTCFAFQHSSLQSLFRREKLGGHFGYFYFFLLREGEGRVRGVGMGGGFLGGGGLQERGGLRWPGGCLRRIGEWGEGGGKFFFFGAEMSTKKKQHKHKLFGPDTRQENTHGPKKLMLGPCLR